MEQSLESFGSWFRELYHLDKPDVREYSALAKAMRLWNVFTNVPAALSKQKHRPI